jgi:uncharacterized protein YjiS (DUF1127 family)
MLTLHRIDPRCILYSIIQIAPGIVNFSSVRRQAAPRKGAFGQQDIAARRRSKMTRHTLARPAAVKAFRALESLVSTPANRIRRFFVHRAAIAHVRGLDDWALYDIGLARSEIETAIRGVYIPHVGSASLHAARPR